MVLCTKGVLTRPWCLLELYEARRHHIPVVPVVLTGRGFTIADARHFLLHLEVELEKVNPGAIAMITQYLAKDSVSLVTFVTEVKAPSAPPPLSAQRGPSQFTGVR